MSARRFDADSTPAAFAAVRAAFGDDAFILSNRRVGGRVEVIASRFADVADVDDRGAAASATASPRSDPARVTRVDVTAHAGDDETAPIAVAAEIDDTDRSSSSAAQVVATPPPGPSLTPDADSACESEPEPEPHSVPQPEAARRDEPSAPVTHEAADDRSVAAIATRLQRMEVALWGERDDARSEALCRLLQLGLGANTALRLIDGLMPERTTDADAALRTVLSRLAAELPVTPTRATGDATVTVLCGPDGDARRELLMQLAHRGIAERGAASVALVSADASRPGAFDELEALGRGLGCIVVRAREGEPLPRALDTLAGRERVLVDAGENWPAARTGLRRWLVLPATLQRSVAAVALKNARCAGADGCALTRLDSAGRPGECLDAVLEHWLPIACWNDGAAIERAPKPADASLLVAAAVASARRLGELAHDRSLAALLRVPAAPASGTAEATTSTGTGVATDAGTGVATGGGMGVATRGCPGGTIRLHGDGGAGDAGSGAR